VIGFHGATIRPWNTPRHWAALLLLCALFGALVWPVVLSGRGGPTLSLAQKNFHEPVIRQFAADWPHVDLVNYNSATTPGYHLLIALCSRFLSPDRIALQMISSLLSLGMIAAVFRSCSRHVGPWIALALTLPVLCSTYVIGSSIWLTTDNAAWLPVVLALGGLVMLPPTADRLARWGIYATVAVFVRQIHLWLAGPLWLTAALFGRFGRPVAASSPEERPRGLAFAVPALLAPVALFVTFFFVWGGMAPPTLEEKVSAGISPAAYAVALAMFGGFGVFFLPAFVTSASSLAPRGVGLWLAVAAAVIASIIGPTSYDVEAGRWGGLIWQIVARLPAIADRSLVFPPLAALGGYVLVTAWRGARRAGRMREASMLMIALGCWLLAQSANKLCFARYFEPMVLIALAWLAIMSSTARDGAAAQARPRKWWIGPLALAAVQLALAMEGIYGRLTP
jgi:hypothetical protein